MPPVPAPRVADLVGRIEALGCAVWLDGGWGADALLGRETRPHDDVDIVVETRDLARLRAAFATWGFAPADDGPPWNFVLADAAGHRVDVHAVTFDTEGRGLYGPPEQAAAYPAEAFSGRGLVEGRPVRCMSLRFQLGNRTGYTLRAKDHHDLRMLRALQQQA